MPVAHNGDLLRHPGRQRQHVHLQAEACGLIEPALSQANAGDPAAVPGMQQPPQQPQGHRAKQGGCPVARRTRQATPASPAPRRCPPPHCPKEAPSPCLSPHRCSCPGRGPCPFLCPARAPCRRARPTALHCARAALRRPRAVPLLTPALLRLPRLGCRAAVHAAPPLLPPMLLPPLLPPPPLPLGSARQGSCRPLHGHHLAWQAPPAASFWAVPLPAVGQGSTNRPGCHRRDCCSPAARASGAGALRVLRPLGRPAAAPAGGGQRRQATRWKLTCTSLAQQVSLDASGLQAISAAVRPASYGTPNPHPVQTTPGAAACTAAHCPSQAPPEHRQAPAGLLAPRSRSPAGTLQQAVARAAVRGSGC